jgi:nitrate/TMAO reductase-like tetraheme cytochrome c subunit
VTRRAALLRHPVAILGAVIATATAVVFIALAIAMIAGMLANPYAGLVVFVAVPAAFVIGLLLIPIGMWLERRKLAREPGATADWPVIDLRLPRVRKIAVLVTALTAVNVVIILLAGYGSLHWMESPTFCGQACHTPMQPQFAAWQGGPHAGVACVQCHIGEGAAALVHAKLSGVRQLVHVATGSYPRPIPPGAEMPPGAQAQTCVRCHQPGRIRGDQVRVVREYAEDEANTETVTVLQMHLDRSSRSGRAIHWHADPNIRIEYVATDATNQTIPYVKVTNAQGQVKEYVTEDANQELVRSGARRTMDCVDCHNTIGHPIAPTPELAVDRAIADGLVDRQLPNVRREGVKLLKAHYSSQDEGARAIEQGLRSFYQSVGGAVDQQRVDQTAMALQTVFRRNVFPPMKVTWGSYPTNRGHMSSNGCFRCHDDSHNAKDKSTISADCEYCHKQIEQPSGGSQ